MENNKFKVRYIRLNDPCEIVIHDSNEVYDYKFKIGEVYFKEYDNTFDIFFIIDEEVKFYVTAINMQKTIYGNTIMFHINKLKSGYYKIYESCMKKRTDGLMEIRSIEKLEEDLYGK